MPSLKKLICGGQTGVDRAALDVALEVGFDCGGWCPQGRKAEDGAIDGRYPLQEASTGEYAQRTWLNVRDSDATLLVDTQAESPGTTLTALAASKIGKPLWRADPCRPDDAASAANWIKDHGVATLNVAGPRESESPGIYQTTRRFLSGLLACLADDNRS